MLPGRHWGHCGDGTNGVRNLGGVLPNGGGEARILGGTKMSSVNTNCCESEIHARKRKLQLGGEGWGGGLRKFENVCTSLERFEGMKAKGLSPENAFGQDKRLIRGGVLSFEESRMIKENKKNVSRGIANEANGIQ